MPSRFAALWGRCWGLLLIVGAVLVGSLYYHDVSEQEDRSRCQARYNEAFMQVVQIRSQLSDLRQDAVNAVLQGVGEHVALPPTDNPEEQQKRSEDFLEIFRAYTRAIEAYELAREAHPLPALPPDC